MLAYVFSHGAGDGVEQAAYESSLREFHAALASAPPSGFLGSATLRIGRAYSDWYLLESSAALDALNTVAVSGARSAPHDAAARMSADPSGKLLSLVAGDAVLAARCEVRFAKPAGMAYADLYTRMQTWTSAQGVGLWRRMMVLGPPPEFCLTAPSELELPPEMRPEQLRREQI